jgi:hypothetical protein
MQNVLPSITAEDVHQYLNALRSTGLSSQEIEARKRAIETFISWATTHNFLPESLESSSLKPYINTTNDFPANPTPVDSYKKFLPLLRNSLQSFPNQPFHLKQICKAMEAGKKLLPRVLFLPDSYCFFFYFLLINKILYFV